MKFNITIFSDYIWPFCYIGKGIVEELKKEFNMEDTWLPLEIHPDTPPEGKNLTSMFPKATLAAMTSNLKAYGKSYGLEFNNLLLLSNSHISLLAGEFAKEKNKFHEYHEAAFRAYFTDNKDIGNINVLEEIFKALDLDIAEFKAAITEGLYEDALENTQREASMNHIQSTPTFIVNNKYAIVGAQPLESFREALLRIEKDAAAKYH